MGNNFRVLLKGQKLGVAEVRSIRQFRLCELTDGCALLDTGYLADQAISLIRHLNYRYINRKGREAYFNWLVLQYVSTLPNGLLVDSFAVSPDTASFYPTNYSLQFNKLDTMEFHVVKIRWYGNGESGTEEVIIGAGADTEVAFAKCAKLLHGKNTKFSQLKFIHRREADL